MVDPAAPWGLSSLWFAIFYAAGLVALWGVTWLARRGVRRAALPGPLSELGADELAYLHGGTDEQKVHPGKDWFTVLSGTVVLLLGERTILVEAGQAAEFSTMIPHAFGAHDGPAEVLCIFDHDGQRTHLQAH